MSDQGSPDQPSVPFCHTHEAESVTGTNEAAELIQREGEAAQLNVPSNPAPKKPSFLRELWSSTGGKAFITSLIAVLLSPISAVIGFGIVHWMEGPDLQFESMTPNTFVYPFEIPQDRWKALSSHDRIIPPIRETIIRYSGSGVECASWLEEGKGLTENCILTVKEAFATLYNSLKADSQSVAKNIKSLESWDMKSRIVWAPMSMLSIETLSLILTQILQSEQSVARKDQVIGILSGWSMELTEEITALSEISEEVAKIEKDKPFVKTGEIQFIVSILNRGDSDGLLDRDGWLQFNGRWLRISCDDSQAIKSHSLVKVTFNVVQPTPTDDDEKKSYDTWKQIIQGTETIHFYISVRSKDGVWQTQTQEYPATIRHF